MDTSQQAIDEIRGTYTDLIDRMHEQGAINEGKMKELLDLGMALPAEKRLKTQHPGPSA